MQATAKVLIVGAGPVGLTLAVELARRGVPFLLIDQKEKPTDQSRALGVHARTLEHLENMGVANVCLERGRKITQLRVSDRAKTVAEITLDLASSQTPFPFVLVLPQSETERILIGRLTELGGKVDWNHRLESFVNGETGVEAVVANTADGATHAIHADWIVGCDGAHSAVRHGLNITFEGAAYPESFLLADVAIDWTMSTHQLQIFLTPDGAIPAFPLPEEGGWRLVDTSGKVESNDPRVVVEHFQSTLRANGYPGVKVTNPTWVATFRIHRRLAGALRQGRAFLAGDSAHIHSPAGGQGMNTGIQDACNLGWKLAMVTQGTAPRSLLDSYEAERLPIVSGVLKGTDLATRIVTLRNPLARAIRNRVMSIVSGIKPLQKRVSLAVSELGVNYRRSPIVGESWTATPATGFQSGPRAGERVPDVVFGSTRLFECLKGTEHVLLLFEADSPQGATLARFQELANRVAQRYGASIQTYLVTRSEAAPWNGLRLLDNGPLHASFGADEPAIYLIRPDHYVGFRSKTSHSEMLERHLEGMFQKDRL